MRTPEAFGVVPNASAVLENLKRMAIDPTSIERITLSHGHWNHEGGVSEIFRAVLRPREAMERP